jgi:hypothetical protein
MKSRVPGLGRLPLVGGLFGATDNEIQKREVIIVLTPHVLAEDAIGVASNRPRDDVMARVSDLMLFNNSYQVRAADIFDMNFLLDDPQYRAYREKALILNGTSPGLNADDPVTQLAEGHIPGERALVAKMLFDIISNSANRVSATVDQVFVPELAAGQNIRHTALAEVLESTGFAADDSSGVWLEFILQNGSNHVSYKAITRTPHDSWAGIESGLRHSLSAGTEGILLHDIADLERLKRSVAVDTVLRLNGGYRSLGVQNLRAGTVLKLGTPADYSNYELSSRTAQIYNDSQYYFNVLQSELTSTYEAMDAVLQKQELLR